MDEIYNSRILELAGNIGLSGEMPDADGVSEKHSKLCGSKVKVFVKMSDGVVTAFSHKVRACALGQASSAVMAKHVVGASAGEVRQARADMVEMLTQGGEGPSGRFEEMRVLQPVRDFKARHASTLLTFDAVVDAISQIEAKHHAEPASA